MNYTITSAKGGKFIIVKVTGDITGRNVIEMIVEAHAIGRKAGINRYLVDATEARNTDTHLGNYEFAYSDIQRVEGIDKSAWVALLVSPEDHSHDFVETVSVNAGHNLKLFTDFELAVKHLNT